MQGTVSFHPLDLGFFDELIQPLMAGEKINPEDFIEQAQRLRCAAWTAGSYIRVLERLLEEVEPPPPPTEGSLWFRVRSRLERLDYRPDPASLTVARKIDPELHLRGRPFLITEGSADRVSTLVGEYSTAVGDAAIQNLVIEQLARRDRSLVRQVHPEREPQPSTDSHYRTELLDRLRQIFEITRAASQGEMWAMPGDARRRPAVEILAQNVPWLAVVAHSRAVPFWTARNLDGLETICRAAGVQPPDVLVPARRLFGTACGDFPLLHESLHTELEGPRGIGSFVAPNDVPALLDFLTESGAGIIKAASGAGEGATCATLLRKIRECAAHAETRGWGYLEAVGIPSLYPTFDEEAELVETR